MKKKKEMSKNDTKITCFGSICSLISAVYFLTMKFTNGMILFQKEKLIIFHTPHPTLNLSCFCLCVRVTIIRKSLIWNIHTLTILTYMVHYNLICCNSQTNYFIFLLCKIKKNCICNFQYLENCQWFQNIFFSKNPNLKKKFHK